MNKFYITAAIDYVNSSPHVGTAYEKIGADALARWKRLCGYNTFFLMGQDEHSTNVEKKAISLGLDPLTYCDNMEQEFRKVWTKLNISFDRLKAKSATLLVKKILEDVNENLEVKDKCLFFLTSVNTPDSIKLVLEQLNSEISYIRAKALKYITAITNDSFGYDPNSITEERTKALQKFETWWKKQYSQ